MATETSKSIRDWGDVTFGAPNDLVALVDRARLEMDELERSLRNGDQVEAGKEAADVTILLHRLVGILGMELSEQVDAKMAINRGRNWTSSGDGTGRHI